MYQYILDIILAYFISDLLIGIYHWIKDTYFSPFTPFIGRSHIWNSRLHHIEPQSITEINDWDIFKDSALWTALWISLWCYFDNITVFKCTLFIIISLNDIVHKYAHMRDNIPLIIYYLQKYYIIQSYHQHHEHHISPHDNNYCPITPYLNILLEKIKLWKLLEYCIEYLFSIKPRNFSYRFIENDLGKIEFIKN